MSIKITYSSGNNYNVKLAPDTKSIKVRSSSIINFLPQKLDELSDVEISEVNGEIDNYVLVYNSNTDTWQAVNPDVVLSASATEPIQPGLPTAFVDEVNTNLANALDNLIDVDAGLFPGE